MYSKRMAPTKSKEENSVERPATSSDSASAKSKGPREDSMAEAMADPLKKSGKKKVGPGANSRAAPGQWGPPRAGKKVVPFFLAHASPSPAAAAAAAAAAPGVIIFLIGFFCWPPNPSPRAPGRAPGPPPGRLIIKLFPFFWRKSRIRVGPFSQLAHPGGP